MAKIHIIFDPSARVEPPPAEIQKQLKLRIAMMQVDKDITNEEIAAIVKELTTILLVEYAKR